MAMESIKKQICKKTGPSAARCYFRYMDSNNNGNSSRPHGGNIHSRALPQTPNQVHLVPNLPHQPNQSISPFSYPLHLYILQVLISYMQYASYPTGFP